MSTNRRERVRPTHEWELLLPLFEWPEQERYEEIRPLVLFDVPVAERAEEVGLSTSTLYRRLNAFGAEGMESLFGSDHARRKRLPPTVRRLILDLKAEYPAFNLNEIANVVHACFGRKPDVRSVARVLDEEPLPLKIVRNYPPYHEAEDPREGRAAIVELRLSGWSAKAIAGYLGIHHATTASSASPARVPSRKPGAAPTAVSWVSSMPSPPGLAFPPAAGILRMPPFGARAGLVVEDVPALGPCAPLYPVGVYPAQLPDDLPRQMRLEGATFPGHLRPEGTPISQSQAQPTLRSTGVSVELGHLLVRDHSLHGPLRDLSGKPRKPAESRQIFFSNCAVAQ